MSTHRDLDFPFDLSDATLALLFLSRFDVLLPLRLESRVRDRDFSEKRDLERDFFSTGDFERDPRDLERLRDERGERVLERCIQFQRRNIA